ncbi:DUF6886 family protein [Streptomyces triticirhizae]|uniref:Uncharacterized protein n=1 Tax=Streptomyces triticirhizae TaxID=2483353 RepID=A0A3M2L3Q9_9ACTN|nr:DUF6886 family protein [Streptomyces triticirhizae]RMI31616.1 hypothetical protein EBN88_25605 [Streptomyces triticirhizae]
MRPAPGEVLHFSEDPGIQVFRPHVSASAGPLEALVWAVDAERAPDYWFPRQCPRAMVWLRPSSSRADRQRLIGDGGGHRVHAIEYGWLSRLLETRLYAYRLPAAPFRPFGNDRHALVAREAVEPLGAPVEVGNLLALHREAGIQLRLYDNLWPFWDAAVGSSLGHSAIRMRNARPRPGPTRRAGPPHAPTRIG